MTAPADIAANVRRVYARIAAAAERAGRTAADVRLIVVAKTKPAAFVRAAIDAGVGDIGENYVQEAIAKRAEITAAVRWHLIGHLQRNKAARAAAHFDVIHTVDSAALGAALARHAAAAGRRLRVLVEVNVGRDPRKRGIDPDALPALLADLGDQELAVDGLMTVPPVGSPEETRGHFRRLRLLRDAVGLRELSMGMSDDFEVAIEEGATMVRVGRAIFGAR
jgi:pyridoxal phosphate enzyme (YggS family)